MKSLKTHHFIISPPKPTPRLISKSVPNLGRNALNFRACKTNSISASSSKVSISSPASPAQESSSSSFMASGEGPRGFSTRFWASQFMEEAIEKVIYRSRFVTLLGVFGSLIGSLLCFVKGCNIVATAFIEQFARSGKAMVLLVEAIDVYLLGTVMMVFGMGVYELFVCNLDIAQSPLNPKAPHRSNLFGLFTLIERPKWLEIKSVNELKTKVGHVIVMLLLIGLFDNRDVYRGALVLDISRTRERQIF